MSIYKNIQAECKKQNVTIMGMEDKLGFSRGSIFKWDKNTPSVIKVKSVADYLGVSVDELLTEKEEA